MNDWIQEDFGQVDLGDKRLDRRLPVIVRQLFGRPDTSPKAACGGWAEAAAAYRFFANTRVAPEKIFAPHRIATLQRIKEYGGDTILCVQDTTELQYSTHRSLKNVGNLGDRGRKGFWAHSQYIVSADGVPLGVWNSKFTIPKPRAPGWKKPKITAAQRRKMPIEEKKTFCWLEGYRISCHIAELNPGLRVISASDREGDIYDILSEWGLLKKQGKPVAEWLHRCQHDRALEDEENDSPQDREQARHLRERVNGSPVLGAISFDVKAKPAQGKKPARTARKVVQEIRACVVELKPPQGKERFGPISVTVISAREIDPPAGEDPIHWILVTSMEAVTLEQAAEIIGFYLVRWEIEVFHKILKSGCTVEKLQFEYPERLVACICLYMVVAWRIHFLTKLGRTCPELPCSVVFDECEWKSVVHILKGPEAVHQEPSLGEFNQMIGQLGGHLDRKADGPPGPQTIWRGMNRMREWALCWKRFGPPGNSIPFNLKSLETPRHPPESELKCVTFVKCATFV
jgi:hypothetical protein